MTLNIGDILGERYRIVKLVGQGGFGAVYRAWDMALKVPVAVKENLDTSPEAQRQFEHEAQLLAPLRHPNLPRVSDHFFVPGQGQYLVMDFVEGKDLETLLMERGGPLSETEALAWIGQVCDALDYLHSRTPPVIHRDIKPQNIIVTADGRAMLVDFGISKAYDPSLTTTRGARAVTPGYSPPEQYGMGKTDARSDVYALGATLYTLLTGRPPPESVALVAGGEALVPVRQANPAISPLTEGAIAAAMALSASHRISNAAALRNALSGVMAEGAGGRAARTSTVAERRGVPAQIWLAAVAVFAVLGVVAYSIFQPPPPTPQPPATPAGTAIAAELGTTAAEDVLPTHSETPITAAMELPATKTPESAVTAVASPGPATPPSERRVIPLPDGTGIVRLLVPGGTFQMGAADRQAEERPVHEVRLDSFWIDQTPVTNAQFAGYVEALGLQTRAERVGSGQVFTEDSWQPLDGANWRHPQGPGSSIEDRADHPVVLVTWEEARDYCAWAGGRLPTEAEWEFAARGPDNLVYPWGQEFDPAALNYCDRNCDFEWRNTAIDDGFAYTSPVGFFPEGASWVGAHDMMGNVWEWVQDWYASDYYAASPLLNPTGPETGALRVARGGGWPYQASVQYASNRARGFPTDAYNGFGFRCAQDFDPTESVPGTNLVTPAGDEPVRLAVPAGSFLMGADDEDADDDEAPIHEVQLDAFWIDATEVTNAQFARFVADTEYLTTDELDGDGYTIVANEFDTVIGANWRHPLGPGSDIAGKDDHPVTLVSWDDADAYCSWAGGRLPREAEWEYAARGPEATTYPWGDVFTVQRVNFCDRNCPMDWSDENADDGRTFAAAVGSFPGGSSWMGASDMAGNVWEWTADWYDPDYYARSPSSNPPGPAGSVDESGKSVRGGAWSSTEQGVRSAVRVSVGAWRGHFDVGFRCVYDTASANGAAGEDAGIVLPGAPSPGAGTTRSMSDPSGDEYVQVRVATGSFLMGSEDGNSDERPVHEVTLDDFWLDRTEVSNTRFASFVTGTGYQTTAEAQGWGYLFDGGNWDPVNGANWLHPQGPRSDIAGRDDHPVVLVSRDDATAFCEWAGGRLPTEAEWEYAARGPENRLWAWGNEFLSDRVNYCDHDCSASWADLSVDDGYPFTAPVASYPDGASWVGALNMTGNVWEWVSDWYASDYYGRSPTSNPPGPDVGTRGIVRGGSWVFEPRRNRTTDRNSTMPTYAINEFGIRCAYDG